MNLRDVLARNLRRRRSELDLSQEDLAAKAGCTRNYMGDLERSEYAASVDMIESLSDALDVTPSQFLDPRLPK